MRIPHTVRVLQKFARAIMARWTGYGKVKRLMKRWQSLLLGVVVSALTLWIALRGTDFNQLGGELARGKYIFLIPSILLGGLGLFVRAFRWRSLLNDQIEIKHSFHILNASYLFNTILPLRLGEIVRGYMATRLTPPISIVTSLTSVIVERLLDILAVVVLIVLSIAIAPVTPEIERAARVTGLLGLAGMVVASIFAARRELAHAILNVVLRIVPLLKRLNPVVLLDRLLDGIAPLGSLRGAVAAYGWTALSWAISVGQFLITMYIFYDQPRLNSAFLVLGLAALAVALPAMPGNVGPFEAAIVAGTTLSGVASATDPQQQARALAFGVVLHMVSVLVYAILGFVGLAQERISLSEVMQSARQMATRTAQSKS